jgi:2-polyprenyl-3-methyl-5-hydroxy-6-metoxy-1,4-benzoquinol methylase
MIKIKNSNAISHSLAEAAERAASLYVDEPVDYKGRKATVEGVHSLRTNRCYRNIIQTVVEHVYGSKILDVGISYGIYDVVLKNQFGFDVFGVDHPDNVSVYCRFPTQQKISVLPCDVHFDNIPFPEETFDAVIASEIIEHLLISPKAFLEKLRPVLKSGGKLILTTPNFANLRNILGMIKGFNPAGLFPDDSEWLGQIAGDIRVHPREYTIKEVKSSLAAAGFNVICVRTANRELPANSRLRALMLNAFMAIAPSYRENLMIVAHKP